MSMDVLYSSGLLEEIESSFQFTPSPRPSPSTSGSKDLSLDIKKYIPVGCLRIWKSDCAISSEVWKSCRPWRAFAHPRDVYSSNQDLHLLNALQEILFSSTTLQPYRGLHNAGWIKMEFRMRDHSCGQIRVYVLPDDIGRSVICREDASLRRVMRLLLVQIDIDTSTWQGEWAQDTPVSHIDRSMNESTTKDDASLFHIFNTLPSPNPDPTIVSDRYAREAMRRILDGNIPGLRTRMFSYQRRSAALMLQRETQPDQNIDPRLRMLTDQKGDSWYCDLDAGLCLREPRRYEAPRGGICAETMGLGKTLICLALILATKNATSRIPAEYSVGTIPIRKKTGSLVDIAAATIGRSGVPYKSQLADLEAEGYSFARCREAIKRGAGHYSIPGPEPRRQPRKPIFVPSRKIWLTSATLVIVPSNLLQQWRHEIRKHTDGLNVLVVTMKTELPCAAKLAEYDLILFSNARFVKEAKDGQDNKGRKVTTSSTNCRCPYIGSTRIRDCTCFKEEDVYHSPLRHLHFKRIITDEGHTFGNASKNSRTDAITVLDMLQLSARWIISGTPTRGLYGVEISTTSTEDSSLCSTPIHEEESKKVRNLFERNPLDLQDFDSASEASCNIELLFYKQERTDLEKLGNIATVFLKARPWANTHYDNDQACWVQHVMQPRHGPRSHGNMDCLRATLESMIIRHRPDDILQDVTLPPLHQDIVYLDGSMQNKLSLNVFSLMIIANAITSERMDADYFFHPRQRKALQDLVSNLRQASFFWSGTPISDIQNTLDISRKFLAETKVSVTPEDRATLQLAIQIGEALVSNKIFRSISITHEVPMFIENKLPKDIQEAWALDAAAANPTLMGQTMVHAAQKFVEGQLWKDDPMDGMVAEGWRVMDVAKEASKDSKKKGRSSTSAENSKVPEVALAGGVRISNYSSPTKRSRTSVGRALFSKDFDNEESDTQAGRATTENERVAPDKVPTLPRKSALKISGKTDIAGTLDPSSPLNFTSIISTASAKLSYLVDRITEYQEMEKIIVFYEADNVAYYIAQALECLGVKHLIYAKSLSSERRSQYVVTFNRSETFRVLLMDVSQAAFGLDLSSASRVYFVNPVFNPQVEAQAVKRAHRIGQTRPVYVETLVLRGSIEEIIMERRQGMSTEEHKKCKNILDDQTVYDWIRNARFLPFPSNDIPGPEQMTKLKNPQLVFCRGGLRTSVVHDPDADLILDEFSPKSKGKRKESDYQPRGRERAKSPPPTRREMLHSLVVSFADDVVVDDTESRTPALPTNQDSSRSPSVASSSGCSNISSPLRRPPPADLPHWMDPDQYISSVQDRLAMDPSSRLEKLRASKFRLGRNNDSELEIEVPGTPRAASRKRLWTESSAPDDRDVILYTARKQRNSASFEVPILSSISASLGSSSSLSPSLAENSSIQIIGASLSSSICQASSSTAELSPSKKYQAIIDRNGVKSLLVKLDISRRLGELSQIEENSNTMRRNLQHLGYGHTGKGWKVKANSTTKKSSKDGHDEEQEDEQ